MNKKIVAIGGTRTGRVNLEDNNYEITNIDEEIINLTAKDKPHFLFLAHAQIAFNPENEKRYFEIMQKAYGDLLGCECRCILISDLYDNPTKVKDFIQWADIVYEGWGSTFDMISLWKKTGFDNLLESAWKQGKVMCGISAGAMAWFTYGNTLDKRFANSECNKVEGLGLIDAYLSPHCQKHGKEESEIRSLKNLNQVGISLSDCSAIEIVDNQFKVLKSDARDLSFTPYALKRYWENDELYEEQLNNFTEYESLDSLLSKSRVLKK